MKHLILASFLLVASLFSYSQLIVQSGLGVATSGFVHPVTEMDLGWNFDNPSDNVEYQATVGYLFNPYIDKSVYSVKLGAQVSKWTFKAGVGLVNQNHNINERYVYVSAYTTLVVGVERYIAELSGDHYKVYYGVDLVDGDFYGKLGFRFQYKKRQ